MFGKSVRNPVLYSFSNTENEIYFGNETFKTSTDKILLSSCGIFDTTLNHKFFTICYDIEFSIDNADTKRIMYCTTVPLQRTNNAMSIYYKLSRNTNYIDYIGETRSTRKYGIGTQYYTNGQIKYSGEFNDDIFSGEGTLYDDNNTVIYTGRFSEGAPDFN